MGTVDLYCERLGPGLLAEPLNATTNLAFFIAAWRLWRRARDAGKLTGGVILLLILLVAFGIGSSLFHTFATPMTHILDVLPIALFMCAYLWLYLRAVLDVHRLIAGFFLVCFVLAVYVGRRFPNILNGSLFYAPALVAVSGLGVLHSRQQRAERWTLLWAGVALIAALTFRSIDSSVCGQMPIGTHFLWHLFAATALYLAGRALIANLGNPASHPPS
jgi:hypothetical protein